MNVLTGSRPLMGGLSTVLEASVLTVCVGQSGCGHCARMTVCEDGAGCAATTGGTGAAARRGMTGSGAIQAVPIFVLTGSRSLIGGACAVVCVCFASDLTGT